MRHVLFVVPTLAAGGAERVVVTLLKQLDRRRFRLTLAVVDTRGAVFRSEVPEDVAFIDLGARRVRYGLPKIIAVVRRLKPDVVFSTLGHLNVALGMCRWMLPRSVRTVARETTVVSCGLKQHRPRPLWLALYRRFYRCHDIVVCQSQYMYDDLVENFGFPPQKACIIRNPIDVEHVRRLARWDRGLPIFPPPRVNLVAAGRLEREKGFELLIDAIALLNAPFVHVFLMGEGPLERKLKEQASRLGLGDRIHFVGFQKNPYAWLARADAFVLSSLYEGFPNVVLEALACGTPVIATPAVGGTREILQGLLGCVIAEDISASGLAKALNQWLRGPRDRVAQTAVDPYRVERIVGEYEALLSQERVA